MDLGADFREFSNLSLIASQLENVGWGQIGVNISLKSAIREGGVEQTERTSHFVLHVSKSLILLKNLAFLFLSFPTILPYIVSRIRAENLPDIYHLI